MGSTGIYMRKGKMVLNMIEGKPERYILKRVPQKKVMDETLVAEIMEATGVNATQTKAVVEALKQRISHYLDLGHSVQLADFGTFGVGVRRRTAKRLEDLDNSSIVRCVVKFTAGKRFKQTMKALSITAAPENLDDPAIQAPGGVGA